MNSTGDAEEDITLAQARAALREGTGKGIRVAVIDSGVDASHPRFSELKLRDSVGIAEQAGQFVAIDGEGHDVYGHGTAVASIIHEIAPEAEIGSFRTIDARSLSRTALICAGIREAIRREYHILNCSFGCKGLAKFILPHKEWADEAWLSGIHVVAACSNDDDSEVEWPSHFTNVLSVNLARTDSDDIFYRPRKMIGYAARGENVEVAWLSGGTQIQTGSSFAAPRLTGKVARVLSVFPHLTPARVHDLLPRLASPWRSELSPAW